MSTCLALLTARCTTPSRGDLLHLRAWQVSRHYSDASLFIANSVVHNVYSTLPVSCYLVIDIVLMKTVHIAVCYLASNPTVANIVFDKMFKIVACVCWFSQLLICSSIYELSIAIYKSTHISDEDCVSQLSGDIIFYIGRQSTIYFLVRILNNKFLDDEICSFSVSIFCRSKIVFVVSKCLRLTNSKIVSRWM